MQSVVGVSQLHATDSEFSTYCLREQQFGERSGTAPHLRRKVASIR
jgi:hypothetical protein